SETETRQLYHDAEREVNVLTKSFEYFESIEPALREALERGIDVQILFLEPNLLSEKNEEVQRDIIGHIDEEYPAIDYRFSVERLPWR
ncbi:MAG: TrmB family transcriptional regulator, partial [Halobacteria archaeon]|nr:TrmB family transcriptional regulator [Halobacteria archaeon]